MGTMLTDSVSTANVILYSVTAVCDKRICKLNKHFVFHFKDIFQNLDSLIICTVCNEVYHLLLVVRFYTFTISVFKISLIVQ